MSKEGREELKEAEAEWNEILYSVIDVIDAQRGDSIPEDVSHAQNKVNEMRERLSEYRADEERYKYIIAVMKSQMAIAYTSVVERVEVAHAAVMLIEKNTRVKNGRLEVWCLGEWNDVEEANAEVVEKVKA